MKPLSKYEKGVVAVTCAAGLGVALTAALASTMSVEEKPEKEMNDENGEMELELDLTLPKTQEEAMQMWVEGYVHNKEVLVKAFKFFGQMAMAPVVMIAIDAGYAWYKGRQ